MNSLKIKTIFNQQFQSLPELIVSSPGRINLIGEHTDYNMGFVVPAAIDKAIYFAFSKREDTECHIYAMNLDSFFKTNLQDFEKSKTHTWANYILGVVNQLQKRDFIVGGFNLVFGGDLPTGAGVSSSAALDNGVGFALNELFGLGLSRLDLVKISQDAENQFVGMNCGVMDMFASMMGKENHVIRLDCRDWSFEYFPLETTDYLLVLCNTMVKHQLVDSEYNTRRKECEEGVTFLQQFDDKIQSLRDVSLEFLQKYKADLREVVYRRCKYVIEEINRVEEACKALEVNEFSKVGMLMFETHEGLKNDYEVSCKELDFLVEKAKEYPKSEVVLGARMMGGGFGGCTINLVKSSECEDFIHFMKANYANTFGIEMETHIVSLKKGTRIIE